MIRKLADALIERESRPERVGPRVTALRETLAMSKAQFADALELDRSSLSKIEAGKAGLDIAVAERMAMIFGYGLDFIYRGDLNDVPADQRQRLVINLLTFTRNA